MRFRFLPKNKISQLPKSSGVYAFKKDTRLFYVGKAANIRERVKSHHELLNQVKQLGYIKTDSEIEALVLEANLIKKYQPKFNVVWRDDKNYFYVCITREDFPRIYITHQIKQIENTSRSIGPFVDGQALKQTLKILRKVFPYRTCKNLPKRPCLWYQLDRCLAPCLLKAKIPSPRLKRDCQRNVKNLIKILRGEKQQTLKDLEREMKKFSQEEKFEEAAKIKNQIFALEKVLAHSHIFESVEVGLQQLQQWLPQWRKRIEAYDVSNIQGKEATGSMVVFTNGEPDKSQYRKFKIKISGRPNDVAMIKEILRRRFKHPEWSWPDLILIDGGKAQLNAALQCLRPGLKHIGVMSLAKKENKLYIVGRKGPVLLKNLPREIFNLILQLRDEAHRFARKYHHKLRREALFS